VHGAPIAFHGSIVGGDELRRDLPSISSLGAMPTSASTVALYCRSRVSLSEYADPERIDGLIGENVVPIVGLRPTHAFQGAL
jgi:hypothetical protein